MSSETAKMPEWISVLKRYYQSFMSNQRIFHYAVYALVACSVILLLLFFLQPTNVEVANASVSYFYMWLFGAVGLLFGLYVSLYLVLPMAAEDLQTLSLAGKIFHYIGVWGTRFCIVFIIYLMFAMGGFLLPKHIVNWGAAKTFDEQVEWLGYRLAGTSYSKPNRFVWFSNEFLVLERTDKKTGMKKKIVLWVDNVIGTNKLDYVAVVEYMRGKISEPDKVRLLGRKSASGIVYDAVKLVKP